MHYIANCSNITWVTLVNMHFVTSNEQSNNYYVTIAQRNVTDNTDR